MAKPGSYEWSLVGPKHRFAQGARYSLLFSVGTGGIGTILYGMNPEDSKKDIRNTWHHIAYMGESAGYHGAFDGDRNSSGPFIAVPDSDSDLYIGGHPERENSFFRGAIDELRFSTVARYAGDFDVPKRLGVDDKTSALWHFDEFAVSAYRDVVQGVLLRGSALSIAPLGKLTTTWSGMKTGRR